MLVSSLILVSAKKEKDPTIEPRKAAAKAFLKENKQRDGIITLKSGLQYKILKNGSGKWHPSKESEVEIHFAATTLDLTPDVLEKNMSEWNTFDSSYKYNRTSAYQPKTRVQGWKQAYQLMVKGDQWEMYIPPSIGYGDKPKENFKGLVKGGDMLIINMEIVDIKGGKVSALTCDLKTREHCNEDEIALLDKWAKKPANEIEAEVNALYKKRDGMLKAGEREKILFELKTVRQIHKARAKGDEL